MTPAALRAILLAAVAGCGSSPDDKPRDHGSSPMNCLHRAWCEPADQAAREAAGVAGSGSASPEELGCKTNIAPSNLDRTTFDRAATAAERTAGHATACCYEYQQYCAGRPLVVDGLARTAPVPRVDHAEAARWLADAAAEHASIAAFARAIGELMAVGAPAWLVAETAAALADEIRHAALCFALAARFAGHPVAPGPLPAAAPRAADLAQLACDVFVEGCVGETRAVLAAAARRETCRDPEARRALDTIIADETRHAALAWRTLRWAIATGGPRVAAAVQALAARAEPDAAWRDVVLPALAGVMLAA